MLRITVKPPRRILTRCGFEFGGPPMTPRLAARGTAAHITRVQYQVLRQSVTNRYETILRTAAVRAAPDASRPEAAARPMLRVLGAESAQRVLRPLFGSLVRRALGEEWARLRARPTQAAAQLRALLPHAHFALRGGARCAVREPAQRPALRPRASGGAEASLRAVEARLEAVERALRRPREPAPVPALSPSEARRLTRGVAERLAAETRRERLREGGA